MKFLSNIPSWLKNKYLITGAFFIVWMLFFDPKDLASTINRIQTYHKLQKTEETINSYITETRKDERLLKTNPQTIEKYAREKYMMKKDNEDLFIINTPATTK
jgi:cell division protein DivIC